MPDEKENTDRQQQTNKPPADLVDALAELRSSTAKTAAEKVLCHLAGTCWPEPEKKKTETPAPAPTAAT